MEKLNIEIPISTAVLNWGQGFALFWSAPWIEAHSIANGSSSGILLYLLPCLPANIATANGQWTRQGALASEYLW